MAEAIPAEFPFVERLSKRKQNAVSALWAALREMKRLEKEVGSLIPAAYAATLLGISRQRVHQLLECGKLERVEIHGHVYVSERSITDWAQSERLAGRPCVTPSLGSVIKDGWQARKEWQATVKAAMKKGS